MQLLVDNVACARGGRLVFDDCSFQADPGNVVHLRGPNGAGKTSLLLLIAGLLSPVRGSIRIDSKELPATERSTLVAYLGHKNALKPAFTLKENVASWLATLRVDPRKAEEALLRAGVGRRAQTPAMLCSAGEQHRAALAVVFALNRPLWLLDEPATSLDAAGTDMLGDALAEHAARGGISITATHRPIRPDPDVEISLGSPGTSGAA